MSAANADWSDLRSELDRWEEAGQLASLWWRDDDAVAATPALDRLLSLAGPIPLALAVIPEAAETGLAAALRGRPHIAVLQHGWSHANHAGAGRKSEFPPGRRPDLVAADLDAGRRRLTGMFAEIAPVLAPPWNRLAPEFEVLLATLGIEALSTMASRQGGATRKLDVHVDLTAWKAGRGFVGTGPALGGIVAALRRRRLGLDAAALPTGILTHHLIMDDATAEFVGELVAAVAEHAAAGWADIREALP
ncbi:MAG TPA: hypothetical protein VHW66_00730 [Stellaceae bacterium]|nr:hypothetical protein [Stellaceae bacterium]